jgi:hypothetical protein
MQVIFGPLDRRRAQSSFAHRRQVFSDGAAHRARLEVRADLRRDFPCFSFSLERLISSVAVRVNDDDSPLISVGIGTIDTFSACFLGHVVTP